VPHGSETSSGGVPPVCSRRSRTAIASRYSHPVEILACKSEQLAAQRVLCAADLSCDVEQPLSTIRFG
jgi:hypothetical protein